MYRKAKIVLKDGDEIILKDFCVAKYPVFSAFAAKFISDYAICEDIVQDVFVNFWEKQKTFLNIYTVKAYFYKSIRNSCLDYIKHEKVKKKYIEYNARHNDTIQFFWEEVLKKEAYNFVYQEINKLPEMGKKVLLLALKEKSNKEIAQELDITVNTVKTHKGRAYKVLREKLGGLFLLFISLTNSQRNKLK